MKLISLKKQQKCWSNAYYVSSRFARVKGRRRKDADERDDTKNTKRNIKTGVLYVSYQNIFVHRQEDNRDR